MTRRYAALLCAVVLGACSETATTPGVPSGTGMPAAGLTEITISGLTSGQPVASVRSIPTEGSVGRRNGPVSLLAKTSCFDACDVRLASLSEAGTDGTIDLKPVSVSTFTVGSGLGGYRYVTATYQVRNATIGGVEYTTPRSNLTFIAIETPATLEHTAISVMRKFNGAAAAISARDVMPVGAATIDRQLGLLTVAKPDAFQVYDPSEVSVLNSVPGVTAALPYGFVVSDPADAANRTMAGNPGSTYQGMVTFAFKVPLAASPVDDAFTISARFLPVDDADEYVTQTLEETTSASRTALLTRAGGLGTTNLRSLISSDINGEGAEFFCLTPSTAPLPSPEAYPGPC